MGFGPSVPPQVVKKLPGDAPHKDCWDCFIRGMRQLLLLGSAADAMSFPSLRQAWVSKGDVSWLWLAKCSLFCGNGVSKGSFL